MVNILRTTFTSSDWHDWREQSDIMTDESGKIDFAGKDIIKTMFNDAFEGLDVSGEDIKNMIKTLKEEEAVNIEELGEGDECQRVYDIKIKKEETNPSYDGLTRYVFTMDFCCTTITLGYDIFDSEKMDLVYLPVREFICCPKINPLDEIAFCEPFDTYEEAKSYKMPEGCHDNSFEEERDTVIVFEKNDLLNSVWYKRQKEIFSNYTIKEIEENFCPRFEIMKIALEVDITNASKSDDIRSITGTYKGMEYHYDSDLKRDIDYSDKVKLAYEIMRQGAKIA